LKLTFSEKFSKHCAPHPEPLLLTKTGIINLPCTQHERIPRLKVNPRTGRLSHRSHDRQVTEKASIADAHFIRKKTSPEIEDYVVKISRNISSSKYVEWFQHYNLISGEVLEIEAIVLGDPPPSTAKFRLDLDELCKIPHPALSSIH
jgi:hypothetical protein